MHTIKKLCVEFRTRNLFLEKIKEKFEEWMKKFQQLNISVKVEIQNINS